MPRRHSHDPSRLRVVAAVALALGVLALQDSANAETNLPSKRPLATRITCCGCPTATTRFLFRSDSSARGPETTRHLSADVEGRVDGVTYLNNTFDDEVLGQLDGEVTWWAVPERFAWVLDDVYGQIATDPFSPIGPDNRQNTNFLSTGPDWYIPLGARMRGYLGGRYGSAQYELTDSDSERLLGIVGIDRAVSSSSRLGVQASTETVDFDSDLQTDFDRHEAYVRYEFSRGQQPELTVNAGYTWLTSDVDDRSAPLLEVLLSRQLSPSVGTAAGTGQSNSPMRASTSPPADCLVRALVPTRESFPRAVHTKFAVVDGVIDFRRSRTMLSFAIEVADELYETETLDRRRYEAQVRAERRMTERMTGIGGYQLVEK